MFCDRYSNALKREEIKSPRNRIENELKCYINCQGRIQSCCSSRVKGEPQILFQFHSGCFQLNRSIFFLGFRIYTVCMQLFNLLCRQMTEYVFNSCMYIVFMNMNVLQLCDKFVKFWFFEKDLYCNLFQVNWRYFYSCFCYLVCRRKHCTLRGCFIFL